MNTKQTKALDTMVTELRASAGDSLVSVVLHGAEARGDHFPAAVALHLCIVLIDLDPATLSCLRPPIAHWLKKGHPMPHFFTEESITASADTFPVELLDIVDDKQILFGRDAFAGIRTDKSHLRLQCERELREKLMRVQEAYVQSNGRSKEISRLLIESYLSFALIFRGCLRLLDDEVPDHADETMTRLCTLADLDPAPFRLVDGLARGQTIDADVGDLFTKYYEQLIKAVRVVDLWEGEKS